MKKKITMSAALLCAAMIAASSCGQNSTPAASASDTSAAAADTTTTEAAAAAQEPGTSSETEAPAETSAGETDDDEPDGGYFDPGLYAAVKDGVIDTLYYFDDETSGHTEKFDGIGGVPFSYEQTFDEVTFHFGSPDDTTVMPVHPDEYGYTVGNLGDSGEYTFSYLGETGDHDVALPETEAVYPFTVPGVYAGMNRGELMNFYVFDDETHIRDLYLGGTGEEYTYDLSDGKIVFHTLSGDVPMTLRIDDYFRPIGEYDGSGAIITFNYVRGAEPDKIVLAEEPQNEEYEPAHPFQYIDSSWEMENVPDSLADMNAVAGRNNAFMLQLDKNAVQNGFEAHFIFLDSNGQIIADHKVKTDSVEDLGIAPAPMLGGFDIVVYPVMLKDILDTYNINIMDVSRFYIADDPDSPCIELVTIEQY